MNSENLNKIVSLIANSERKICLFLGAGSDISSGGKTFAELKSGIVDTYTNHSSAYLDPKKIDKQFEQSIDSALHLHSREVLIREAGAKSGRIADAYKLLVLMAKYKLLSAVITTNFFDCLEEAQYEMGLDVFDIVSNSDSEYIRTPPQQSPKVLYLKIHGDINNGHISHVTQDEIDHKSYPKSITQKIIEHLSQDIVVFVGYSGWDTMVTELVKSHIENIGTVVWINPTEPSENSESELIRVLSKNMIFGSYTFDKFITQLGIRLLNNVLIDTPKPVFIYSLLSVKAQESLAISNKVNIERSVFGELKKEHKICIVSGKSGMGKTRLIEYYIAYADKQDRIYVKLGYDSTESAIDKIVKTLGFKGDSAFSLLYNLCQWYMSNNKYLTIIIDEISDKYKGIEELVAFVDALKSNKNISFIFSTRDTLEDAFANSMSSEQVHKIAIGVFDNQELENLASHYGKRISVDQFKLDSSVRYPLVCDIIFSSSLPSTYNFSSNLFELLESILADKLSKSPQFFHNSLIDIARAEYCHEQPDNDHVQCILETGLITDTSPYYFKYKEFQYYYLGLDLFKDAVTHQNTRNLLISNFQTGQNAQDVFCNACFTYYTRFVNVASICENLLELKSILDACCSPSAIDFCRKCVCYYAKSYPSQFCHAISEIDLLRLNPDVISLIIIGIQLIEDDKLAYDALDICQKNPQFAYETSIYSTERFCKKLSNGSQDVGYFDMYKDIVFSGSKVAVVYKLLFALMCTSFEKGSIEYSEDIKILLQDAIQKCPPEEFLKTLKKYSYNILFNSALDIEADFSAISYETHILDLMNFVLSGQALTAEKYSILINKTHNINNVCIFWFANLIVVQSMVNNSKQTLMAATKILISSDLDPQDIDFLLSSVFMALYYCDPSNRAEFVAFFEQTYERFEMRFFDRPTTKRTATIQRFSEEFDCIFEDGFNPIAFLFYTSNLENDSSRLQQYWTICENLCSSGNINKILIVVHAIGQMISLFPEDGFKALSHIEKYAHHDIIRRGIIRILQENIIRYPHETQKYIEHNPNIDIIDVMCSYAENKNKMIRSRTLEQLHWSRLLYAYKDSKDGIIEHILSCATKSHSLLKFISLLLYQGNA